MSNQLYDNIVKNYIDRISTVKSNGIDEYLLYFQYKDKTYVRFYVSDLSKIKATEEEDKALLESDYAFVILDKDIRKKVLGI